MVLTGKNVLITGASSGLGRSIALELARRGNKVAVTARREKLLEEISKEIESLGGRCVVCTADSIVTQQSLKVVETTINAFGHIDLAILNAGGGVAMSMAEATSVDVLGLMRTNYDTLVNYLCPMIEQSVPAVVDLRPGWRAVSYVVGVLEASCGSESQSADNQKNK